MKKLIKKIIDKAFELGVLAKFIIGFFEFIAGVIFAISGKLIVDNIIIALAQQEIAEDPKDLIGNFIIKETKNFSQKDLTML